MTIHHPLRRFLARVCSADTMARIVDPTLADMRWESGSVLWKGYVALAKALAVHAIVSTPAVLSRTWSDDDRAMPKAAGLMLAGACVAAVPLIAVPLQGLAFARPGVPIPVGSLALMLVPQAIALTLPVSLLLAIPLAFRRQHPSARLARRAVWLSVACVVATFVVIAWLMPDANQAFRVTTVRAMTSREGDLPRGAAEMRFTALREKIDVLNLTPGGRIAARPLEFHYHARLALVCMPLPLGVLASAISRSERGRRRPWTMGLAAAGGYFFVFFPLFVGAEALMRWSSLPPELFAWTPIALLAAIVVRIYWSTPALAESSTAS